MNTNITDVTATPSAGTPVPEIPVAETPITETPLEDTPLGETPFPGNPIFGTPTDWELIASIQFSEHLGCINIVDGVAFVGTLAAAVEAASAGAAVPPAGTVLAVAEAALRVIQYLPAPLRSELVENKKNGAPPGTVLLENIASELDEKLLPAADFWPPEQTAAFALSLQTVELIDKCRKPPGAPKPPPPPPIRKRNLCLLMDIFKGQLTPFQGGTGADINLESFLAYYRPRMIAVLKKKGVSEPTAEDITQDFICWKILACPESFLNLARREKGHFRGYLGLSLRRHFLDSLDKYPHGIVDPQAANPATWSPSDFTLLCSDHDEAFRIVLGVIGDEKIAHYLMHGDPAAAHDQKAMAAKVEMEAGSFRVFLTRMRPLIRSAIHAEAFAQADQAEEAADDCFQQRRLVDLGLEVCPDCLALQTAKIVARDYFIARYFIRADPLAQMTEADFARQIGYSSDGWAAFAARLRQELPAALHLAAHVQNLTGKEKYKLCGQLRKLVNVPDPGCVACAAEQPV